MPSGTNGKRFLFCLLLFAAAAAAQVGSPFQPLESWKAAVMSGDRVALAKLYSVNPPARLVAGKSEVPESDELRFWSGLPAAGLRDLDPKILSIRTRDGVTQLVLRLKGHAAAGQAIAGGMVQAWAKEPDGWRIVGSQRSDFAIDAGRRLPEPVKPNPQLYPDPAEATAEMNAARARAAKERKRVLVVFGANWCYDCHVLDNTFRSKEFAPLVNANFVVVHINIGDEGKDNNDLAQRLGVGLDRGIPSLAVLSGDGKVLTAQRNGEFESTVKIGPEDVRAFLEKWKPGKS